MTAYAAELDELLARLDAGFPPVEQMDPEHARAAIAERLAPLEPSDAVRALDQTIRRDDGTSLGVRVYAPAGGGTAPRPAVVFLHGGGFVLCSIASHERLCRDLALLAGIVIVSVEYRLAPEHRAPAAAEDACLAGRWAARHGRELGTDGTVVLAGDSAGGNLAAAAALSGGAGSADVVGQVLLYPMLDPDQRAASHERYGSGHYLSREAVRWYWDQYLGDPRVEEPISLVTPARVADLRNAPPAVVVTAGRDPLCDEGVGYARALAAAGVSVRHRHYSDLFHGFLTIPDLPAARSALALLAADLHAICRPVHDRQEQR